MIFSFFAFWFRPVSGFERALFLFSYHFVFSWHGSPHSNLGWNWRAYDFDDLLYLNGDTHALGSLRSACGVSEQFTLLYSALISGGGFGAVVCFGAVVSPADWCSSDGIEGLVTNENRYCELDDMIVFRADDYLWFHTIEFGLQTCDSHFTALNLNLESRSFLEHIFWRLPVCLMLHRLTSISVLCLCAFGKTADYSGTADRLGDRSFFGLEWEVKFFYRVAFQEISPHVVSVSVSLLHVFEFVWFCMNKPALRCGSCSWFGCGWYRQRRSDDTGA